MIYETMSKSLSYFNWIPKGKKRKWDHNFLKIITIKNIPNLDENLFLLILKEVPNRKLQENYTEAHDSLLKFKDKEKFLIVAKEGMGPGEGMLHTEE